MVLATKSRTTSLAPRERMPYSMRSTNEMRARTPTDRMAPSSQAASLPIRLDVLRAAVGASLVDTGFTSFATPDTSQDKRRGEPETSDSPHHTALLSPYRLGCALLARLAALRSLRAKRSLHHLP